ELAWHLVESLILDEFDMAVTADFDVDHGLTVPMSIAYDQTAGWPTKVIPLRAHVI
ncbi:MAG TPA: protocatechuate 3,4-dioxygenase, partial [Alphaproteobacteria bacterium]|nr:protocatechuate 3,4-dioxygenase [Alphaproteobacteria bacterium]